MCEHHGVHQPDARRQPRGAKVRHGIRRARQKEQQRDGSLGGAELQMKEVRQQRGAKKTAGETVERKQGRDAPQHLAAFRSQRQGWLELLHLDRRCQTQIQNGARQQQHRITAQ